MNIAKNEFLDALHAKLATGRWVKGAYGAIDAETGQDMRPTQEQVDAGVKTVDEYVSPWEANCWCLEGAFSSVDEDLTGVPLQEWRGGEGLIHVGGFAAWMAVVDSLPDTDNIAKIPAFNDNPETTLQDVLDVITKAKDA